MIVPIKVDFGEYTILLKVGDSPQEFATELTTLYNFDFTEEDDDVRESVGFVKKHERYVGFYLQTGYKEADFVHELFHATYRMLYNINIPLNGETEEVYARYQDMLYRLIKQELNKLNNV